MKIKLKIFGYILFGMLIGWIWTGYFTYIWQTELVTAIHFTILLFVILVCIDASKYIVWNRSFSEVLDSEKRLIAENDILPSD